MQRRKNLILFIIFVSLFTWTVIYLNLESRGTGIALDENKFSVTDTSSIHEISITGNSFSNKWKAWFTFIFFISFWSNKSLKRMIWRELRMIYLKMDIRLRLDIRMEKSINFMLGEMASPFPILWMMTTFLLLFTCPVTKAT